MKLLNLTAGSRSNPVHVQVEFAGTLMPELAISVAKRAFGHANGVTVSDPDTAKTYRINHGKARDITDLESEYYAILAAEAADELAATGQLEARG